jgi:hypothetical protein
MTLFASPHILEPVVIIRQVAGYRDAALQGEWVPGSETRTEVSAVTRTGVRVLFLFLKKKGLRLPPQPPFRLTKGLCKLRNGSRHRPLRCRLDLSQGST